MVDKKIVDPVDSLIECVKAMSAISGKGIDGETSEKIEQLKNLLVEKKPVDSLELVELIRMQLDNYIVNKKPVDSVDSLIECVKARSAIPEKVIDAETSEKIEQLQNHIVDKKPVDPVDSLIECVKAMSAIPEKVIDAETSEKIEQLKNLLVEKKPVDSLELVELIRIQLDNYMNFMVEKKPVDSVDSLIECVKARSASPEKGIDAETSEIIKQLKNLLVKKNPVDSLELVELIRMQLDNYMNFRVEKKPVDSVDSFIESVKAWTASPEKVIDAATSKRIEQLQNFIVHREPIYSVFELKYLLYRLQNYIQFYSLYELDLLAYNLDTVALLKVVERRSLSPEKVIDAETSERIEQLQNHIVDKKPVDPVDSIIESLKAMSAIPEKGIDGETSEKIEQLKNLLVEKKPVDSFELLKVIRRRSLSPEKVIDGETSETIEQLQNHPVDSLIEWVKARSLSPEKVIDGETSETIEEFYSVDQIIEFVKEMSAIPEKGIDGETSEKIEQLKNLLVEKKPVDSLELVELIQRRSLSPEKVIEKVIDAERSETNERIEQLKNHIKNHIVEKRIVDPLEFLRLTRLQNHRVDIKPVDSLEYLELIRMHLQNLLVYKEPVYSLFYSLDYIDRVEIIKRRLASPEKIINAGTSETSERIEQLKNHIVDRKIVDSFDSLIECVKARSAIPRKGIDAETSETIEQLKNLIVKKKPVDSVESLIECVKARSVIPKKGIDAKTSEKIEQLKNLIVEKKPVDSLELLEIIRIRLASPEEIKGWATTKFPDSQFVGQVKTGDTVNYKTLRPVMEGLFCERIFGPIKDFECSCGKKRNKKKYSKKENYLKNEDYLKKGYSLNNEEKKSDTPLFCDSCKVEYTWSTVRRNRLGYIHLTLPVTHVWYLKGRKSFISILLGFRRKRTERVTYCIERLFSFTPKKRNFLNSNLLVSNQYFKEFSTGKYEDFLKVRLTRAEWRVMYAAYKKAGTFRKLVRLKEKPLAVESIAPKFSIFLSQIFSETTVSGSDWFEWCEWYVHFVLKGFKKSFLKRKKKQEQNLSKLKVGWWSNVDRVKIEDKQNVSDPSIILFYTFDLWECKVMRDLRMRASLETEKMTRKYESLQKTKESKVSVPCGKVLKEFYTIIKTPSKKIAYLKRLEIKTKYLEKKKNRQRRMSRVYKIETDYLFQRTAKNERKKFFKRDRTKFKTDPGTHVWHLKNFICKNEQDPKKDFLNEYSEFLKNTLIFLNLPEDSFYSKEKKDKHPGKIFFSKKVDLPYDLNFQKKPKKKRIQKKGRRSKKASKGTIHKILIFKFKVVPSKNRKPLKKKYQRKLERFEVFYTSLQPPEDSLRAREDSFRARGDWNYNLKKDLKKKPKTYKFKEINNGPLFQRYQQEETLPINGTFNWDYDEEEEFSGFYDLLSPLHKDSDFPNPLYNKKVKNVELNLSDFELTNIKYFRKKLSQTGGPIIRERLRLLNLEYLIFLLRKYLKRTTRIATKYRKRHDFLSKRQLGKYNRYILKRAKLAARVRVCRGFILSKNKAEWMILSNIPVIPPDLRPIVPLDGDLVAVSDLNKLYQQIIYRNSRMKDSSINFYKPEVSLRLLQDGVDNLIENGKGDSEPRRDSNDRPLKSLSDILKGKKGRFRFNLLGKRVDYSGRSVIIVGPTLKLHQCGLPKEMAIVLFLPFLIRKLITAKYVDTIKHAKYMIQQEHPRIWQLLESLIQEHPILLNRAPTLHRLGIQAFQPKLVNGRAILLHPLVCPSFNADFDGDQMGVHIPLSFEARAEAWKLMWSRNNFLSPATSQPLLLPTQDMVLGCYYLTYFKYELENMPSHYFSDFNDLLKAYYQKQVSIHQSVWVRKDGSLESEDTLESPLEIRVNAFGQYNQIFSTYQHLYDPNGQQVKQYIRTTPGRVLLNQIFFH